MFTFKSSMLNFYLESKKRIEYLRNSWYGTGSQYFLNLEQKKLLPVAFVMLNVDGACVCFTCLAGASWQSAKSFSCPRQNESWHERIYCLKTDVYKEARDHRDSIGLEKWRRRQKRNLKLLKKHAPITSKDALLQSESKSFRLFLNFDTR